MTDNTIPRDAAELPQDTAEARAGGLGGPSAAASAAALAGAALAAGCNSSGSSADTAADPVATLDGRAAAFGIVTDKTALSVPEGGTATFQVKLSANPGSNKTVTVSRASGDADLTVAGGANLAFTTRNWGTYQTVTLSSASDADAVNGQAVFAVACAGASTVNVTATEAETGSGSSVVIDPVSRIEGHLRIQVEVAGGTVSKAWSTATLFRGIEPMLIGRAPTDAPLITQRLCGVCTYVHGATSIAAIENACGLSVPAGARSVRNLLMAAQFLHDHIVHFYQLHGFDWIDVLSALQASPAATADLAAALSPSARAMDFAAVKARLQGLADTGNLGPFAGGYWGHADYRFSPEENLLLVAHYLEALKVQLNAARMMAVLGGKNPHPQSMVVGGVTCGGELAAGRLAQFQAYLADVRDFVATIYLPDVKLTAMRYPAWAGIGGFSNHLAYGEFPLGATIPQDLFLPRGYILGGNLATVYAVDTSRIAEHVARSWYQGAAAAHPASGVTNPAWTGLDVNSRYSWSKAPRYDGQAMEVGPLSRMLVAYAKNQPQVKAEVDDFLADSGLSVSQLFSTLGRTAARAIEAKVLADVAGSWATQLQQSLTAGQKTVFSNYTLPASAGGAALGEAPRGALGHWLSLDANKKIGNYQMVVPSTWNFGPRDSAGSTGPVEKALVGVPLADPAKPLEILRVVHSYDPCIACGVHLIEAENGQEHVVKAL